VSPVWRHRGSVYGPVFVGWAAAGTAVAGDSVLANRLFFQLSAAVAAAAALWLVWRRTRSVPALAWLGLHPLLGPIVVNGGHNDMYIGLAVLAAAMLAVRRRGGAAGFVLGLAALVKLSALLALGGLLFWAWRRQDRRLALAAAAGTAVTVVAAYLPFLGGASKVLGGADKTVTRASLWNPLASALVNHDAGRLAANPLAPNDVLIAIFYVSLVVVGVVAVGLGWRAARNPGPGPAMGTTTASYSVAAEYTYPWYASWGLPVLAADRPSPIAWVAWAQAALMIAALKLPVHPSTDVLQTVVKGVVTYAAPVVVFAAFVAAGLRRGTVAEPEAATARVTTGGR
jgi:alpha-1,6-mannosyltransferase